MNETDKSKYIVSNILDLLNMGYKYAVNKAYNVLDINNVVIIGAPKDSNRSERRTYYSDLRNWSIKELELQLAADKRSIESSRDRIVRTTEDMEARLPRIDRNNPLSDVHYRSWDATRRQHEANVVSLENRIKEIEDEKERRNPKIVDGADARLRDYINTYRNLIKGYVSNGTVGIIKGYLYQGKIYNDSTELINAFKGVKISNFEYIVKEVVFNDTTGEIKYKYTIRRNFTCIVENNNSIVKFIPYLFKLRITDSTVSGDMFGMPKEKKALEFRSLIEEKKDPYIKFWSAEYATSKKLGQSTYYIKVVNPNNKAIKFLVNDVEIINPKLSGFTPAICKDIRVGSTVKLKGNSIGTYKADECMGEVIGIKANSSSKRISKQCTNRRMDIMTIKLVNDKVLNVYAKDLKFVEHVIKEKEQAVKSAKSAPGWYEDAVRAAQSARARGDRPAPGINPNTFNISWTSGTDTVTAVDFENPPAPITDEDLLSF